MIKQADQMVHHSRGRFYHGCLSGERSAGLRANRLEFHGASCRFPNRAITVAQNRTGGTIASRAMVRCG